MRLDQFLVKSNIGSRSEAKNYIKKGRVNVDGQIVRDSSAHIDENNSRVLFDNRKITYEQYRYYMLNKPAGCVSATRDGLGTTVMDMLGGIQTKGLFPVGRLDKDTEGLLLITDDGKLGHDLTSPKHHVDKVYYVLADNELTDEAMAAFESGIDIGDDSLTLPAQIERTDGHEPSPAYYVTLHEGRFHQIKRMFEACGSSVAYLKRLSMGSLKLDNDLKPGEYRRLTDKEIAGLKDR